MSFQKKKKKKKNPIISISDNRTKLHIEDHFLSKVMSPINILKLRIVNVEYQVVSQPYTVYPRAEYDEHEASAYVKYSCSKQRTNNVHNSTKEG